jgi:hypothetical protein
MYTIKHYQKNNFGFQQVMIIYTSKFFENHLPINRDGGLKLNGENKNCVGRCFRIQPNNPKPNKENKSSNTVIDVYYYGIKKKANRECMGDMRFVWRIGGLVFVFLSAVCLFIPSLTLGVSVPPKENTWIDVAPMQQARSNLGAVAVEGKIYALGGIVSHYQGYGNNTFTVLDTNEVYDPVTNHWEYRTPMPLPSNDFGLSLF